MQKKIRDDNFTAKRTENIKTISFNFLEDLTIHGFVGYFHSVLYDKVTLSTRPIDHTDGMMSWFPMFFPIKVT